MALFRTCRLSSVGSITTKIEVSLSTGIVPLSLATDGHPVPPRVECAPLRSASGQLRNSARPGLGDTHAMPANVLQAVMDAAVEAIILIDRRGTISAFNRSAERLFGYTAAEALGRNVTLLMGEPYHSAHDEYLA